MNATEGVRKRPGMYIGDVDDGGIDRLVLEVVANAFDQYLVGRCRHVDVQIDAAGTVTVTDDGPGLRATGDGALPPLAVILERLSYKPTVDGHRPHVHLWLGGCGLFVVNALSERFEILTVCDGEEARTIYARGEVVEPVAVRASDRPSGTRVCFRADPQIFGRARLCGDTIIERLDELASLAPGFTVTWAIDGHPSGRMRYERGLIDRVERQVGQPLGGVAHHHETYETDRGPVEVTVALAWRRDALDAPAVIDNFVNLGRTENGYHVTGLKRGISTSSPRSRVDRRGRGLVAAVSVVLADVLFGNPTKDRLMSPHVIEPVARATRAALERWAQAHPDAAAVLRARA